ncbi:uncharacterized protein METZ01_LOCUS404921, partial [marine metagenome]
FLEDGEDDGQLGGLPEVRHHMKRLGQLGRKVQGQRNLLPAGEQDILDDVRTASLLIRQDGLCGFLDESLMIRVR